MKPTPAIVVISSLFPSEGRPLAGVFIKERMRRVAAELPVTVISPQPWFPLQFLLRWRWPGYRPVQPLRETVDGLEVLRPRFFAVPGILRRLDALMMSFAIGREVRKLKAAARADVLDAHFLYPDGCAAVKVGRRHAIPVTVTLRGTEHGHAQRLALRRQLQSALSQAARIFTVSASLRKLAIDLGAAPDRTMVVGNGVDLAKFRPVERVEARRAIGLPVDSLVLVTVGGLVERKGFHRVIECLPSLAASFGDRIKYLVIGGPSPEGDMTAALKRRVGELGLESSVRFLGEVRPEDLSVPLSAADVFVLATRNEGWANVLLEAMACGLPVVATRVGGNAEVVCRPELGTLVAFGDELELKQALADALTRNWDRGAIRRYATDNAWDQRVAVLVREFSRIGMPLSPGLDAQSGTRDVRSRA